MVLPTALTPGYGYLYTYTSHPDVACNCLREWLPELAKLARHKGILGSSEDLRVIQCTGGASASAGTHSRGGAFDLAMPDPTRWNSARTYRVLGPKTKALIYLSREMGGLDWARYDADGRSDGDPWENNEHIHGVLNGCPHLPSVALDQVAEYKRGEDGLAGSGRDPHPRPSVLRTWRQGLAWADAQLNPTPAPAPVPEEDEPMNQAQYDVMLTKFNQILTWLEGSGGKLDEINRKVADVDEQTWGTRIPVPGAPGAVPPKGSEWLVGASGKLDELNRKLAALTTEVAALKDKLS